MNKFIKNLSIISLFFLTKAGFTQEKKQLYFLADTINVSPENRILEIGKEGAGYYYLFYCQCLPPYGYGYNLSFGYLDKNNEFSKTTLKKPNFQYISWKELSKIITKTKQKFDTEYDFYITELMPNNKYKTNKVKLVIYKDPIRDFIILEKKQ